MKTYIKILIALAILLPISSLNASNGIWRIYSYKDNTITDKIFIRGNNVYPRAHTGIFTLNLNYNINSSSRVLGFRCAYIK